MGFTNLPHIQYTGRLAECLIGHGHSILPRRSSPVRKHFSAAELLHVDEHIVPKEN